MDFYFPWFGNKRKELDKFIGLIDVDKYDTIVEPFGGSLSFSRYIYDKYPNKKLLISDSDDNLTSFCNNFYKQKEEVIDAVKNKCIGINKETFNTYIKSTPEGEKDFLTHYLFHNKVYGLRKGLFPSNTAICKFHKFLERTSKTDEFFKQNEYLNCEFTCHLEKVKNDSKAFVFLDPPYPIDSECSYYKNNNTLHIWRYLIDFVDTCKCDYIMIINSNIFIDIIFKDKIIGQYHKKYETNSNKKDEGKLIKKSATHLIISNL